MELLPFAISPWREPVAIGHQKVAIASATVQSSLTVPFNAQAATLEYDDGPVVITLDLTFPDGTIHPQRFNRDRDTLPREALLNWRALMLGVNAGAVRVTYYSWQK